MSFILFIALTFILLGRPQDYIEALAPARLAIVFTFLTALAGFMENKKIPLRELAGLKEARWYMLFYLIMILGIPFAMYRRQAFSFVFFQYLANMLFFYLFLVHVDSLQKMKKVLFAACVAALTYAAFSLKNGAFADGRFSFGEMYDANDLAYLFVTLLPLCFYFILEPEGALKKTIAFAAAAASVLVILLTGSRGGFLGLAGAFSALLFSRTSALKPAVKYSLVAIIFMAAAVSVYKINAERFASLKQISDDYNVTSEEGRLGIWKRGLGFILSDPLTGVGVNCFPMAIGYEREATGEAPKWQVAHNAYVQIAAETGLAGFFLFLGLILESLKTFSGSRAPDQDSMTIWLRTAFIGCLITSFFLSQGYSIMLTLFFSFSAAYRRLQSAPAGIPAPSGTHLGF
jgi:O-antigen ligase